MRVKKVSKPKVAYAVPSPRRDSGFFGHYDPKVYKARPINTNSNTKGK